MVGILGKSAGAQTISSPPLVLRSSSLLEEKISGDTVKDLPTFLQSDTLDQQSSLETTLEGQVVLRRGELLIRADKVEYDQSDDLAKARGNVYINRGGIVYEGPEANLHLESFEGFFTQPSYQMKMNNGHGRADRVEFISSDNSVLHKATYSTCQRKPGPSWMPDWFFEADKITMDTARSVAKLEGADIRFKGVPIPLPAMDVPMSTERKSGLLPPNIGSDNIGGLEYTQPIYWNLAPNRDMTFYPTYWSSRGVNLGTELRYTEGFAPHPPFQGLLRFDAMNSDKLRDDQQRWRLGYTHTGLLNPTFAGGGLAMTLNVNRVSDENYWKDFTFTGGNAISRLLNTDANVSWTNGVVTTGVLVQKWQTLQDLADVNNLNRIAPPFDRLPQVSARLQRFNVGGLDFSVDGQLTRFQSARDYDCNAASNGNYNNCAPNADRALAVAQVSRPFVLPYGYVTPKVQLHSRAYQFDGGLPSSSFYTSNGHVGQNSASVTIPTFSLDAGIAFDRTARLFSRDWNQTLEPRLFYVNTPFREQNFLPNYDSGLSAFNFASIYTENAFGGHDRISDSNLLTMGVTTRFIDPDSGAEGARFGLAQRVRFKTQNVYLPEDPTPSKSGLSDILGGGTINLNPSWAVEGLFQYNPDSNNLLRQTVGGRYQPGTYRVMTAAIRTANDTAGVAQSRQVDLGWQWPLHDLWGGKDEANTRGLGEGRWYSVGRMNYDALTGQPVDTILGFEYDAGCWVSRVVRERVQVAEGVVRQRLLFQLELIGFTRVGTNALGSLRLNVPRYQSLNPPSLTPSRFGNYE